MDKKDIYEHLAKIYLDTTPAASQKKPSANKRHHRYLFLAIPFAVGIGVFLLLVSFRGHPMMPAAQTSLVVASDSIRLSFNLDAAKKQVYGAVGIDFIAGPSEVLILADESADPRVVAADLLAQAEHDPDASAILLTTSEKLAQAVAAEVERRLALLPTAGTARPSIDDNGLIVLCDTIDDTVEIANRKAPEHLELDLRDAEKIVPRLTNYGALFIGSRSAEALGDYAAGPNHTLPTSGAARYTGGLSVLNFLKVVTTLSVTPAGLTAIGPAAVTLAQAEGLAAHAEAVKARL